MDVHVQRRTAGSRDEIAANIRLMKQSGGPSMDMARGGGQATSVVESMEGRPTSDALRHAKAGASAAPSPSRFRGRCRGLVGEFDF